jgi:hypothetical protein
MYVINLEDTGMLYKSTEQQNLGVSSACVKIILPTRFSQDLNS